MGDETGDRVRGAEIVPWHDGAWRDFMQLLHGARLPHALLISGSPGTGRNQFAWALTRTLLCGTPSDTGFCGECKTCRLAASGAHGDLLQLRPEEDGKAIGVDAVRNALRFAAGTATQGQRKVMLLSPAEDMTTAAHNAFLKCLEEPAPDTYILLVTARGAPLPATIRSRCQHWQLRDPSTDEAGEWLRTALSTGGTGSADEHAVSRYLRLFGPAPLNIREQLESGAGEALLALQEALVPEGANYRALAAERSAAGVAPDQLLFSVEGAIHDWLRVRSSAELRSPRGRRAFEALDVIAGLRAARRAGSNPNPDLLRFRALQAYGGLWRR